MIRGEHYEVAKWRVKVSHFTEQGYDLKGVIHGGANDGEEVQYYQMMGIDNILCFEPLPSAWRIHRETYPDVPCFELALGNEDRRIELQVAYGDGKGSSTMDTNIDHPEVREHWNQGQDVIVDRIQVHMLKFSSFIAKHPEINLDDYDTLVLDTQGNELDILKGCGDLLQNFKYLSLELSEIPVYKGEAPGQEVVDWLAERGFTQDSPIQSHNDVFFVRSDIKPTSDAVYRGLA